MIERPNTENLNKGLVELENYKNSDINLTEWNLTEVLDDTLFVQYVDVSENGKEIKRGGIFIPLDVNTLTWRIGKVILAGPNCKIVKPGNFVMFPNDKGIKASSVNGLKDVLFLSEGRIFGVVQPK